MLRLIKNLFQHHANAVVGISADVVPSLVAELANVGAVKQGNPDFIHEKFEVLTINDSRRIREMHESRPFSDAVPRVFLLEMHGATREAQNALLKTLEEPRPDNFFFIILPNLEILLPTVRSRLHVMKLEDGHKDEIAVKAAKSDEPVFLKLSVAEKIAMVDGMAADISDEKISKYDAIVFLNGVEKALREKMMNAQSKDASKTSAKSSAKTLEQFSVIARARDYLGDRSSSVKMLLEYVALSL